MKTVSVIGHFAIGKTASDGQTVKTRIITEELRKELGEDHVYITDTHGGRKTLLKAPFQAISALRHGDNVLILPAHNGIRIYAPLLSFFRRFFRNKKLHYIVIGGWLPEFLSKKKLLVKVLKRFDGIYVETSTMKHALEVQDFHNVLVMPNCKELTTLDESALIYPSGVPYKLCTFSRVMKEKGIEDAIEAVTRVNNGFGNTAYTLDIYGSVDSNQTEWFDNLQKNFPKYVRYCGCVDSGKSVDVLKNYFALLFPTHFYTEGIPGTIIDAYAAGIPVISAKWESYCDVAEDGKTGIGYKFDDKEQLKNILWSILENSKIISDMKTECLKKASDYLPEKAISILRKNLD